MRKRTWSAVAILAIALGGVVLSADTLFLRDGRRIEGQLISVQRGVIEFLDESRGRALRVPREDVRRIELSDFVEEPRGGLLDDRVGRPSGLREREVWVGANTAWTNTGLDVRPGQVVYFTTHGGDIEYRRGDRTRAGGAARERRNPGLPLPSRPVGALIAKVGDDSTDFFLIGEEEGPIRMRGSGRLFLGINDDYLADNRGAFRVTVFF